MSADGEKVRGLPHQGMAMRVLRVLLGVLLLQGAAACGDSTGIPADAPASLQVLDGNEQVGSVYSDIRESLRVRVTNREGEPLEGVSVRWTPSTGVLSASESRTNAQGVASVAWNLRNPSTGSFPLGRHTVWAKVSELQEVQFTAYGGRGMELQGVSITPSQVNVASGPATVTVTVNAQNDAGVVSAGAFRLHSPSGAAAGATFALVSSSVQAGVWRGTFQASVQIPQGAEAGPWSLQFNLRNPQYELTWVAENLQFRSLPHQLTVAAAP
jgi:uncharacterized protein YfaS (alpha-2-macroglobulin family)